MFHTRILNRDIIVRDCAVCWSVKTILLRIAEKIYFMMYGFFLIFLLLFCNRSVIFGEKVTVSTIKNNNENSEQKHFVPTKEWQEVRKGQAIPAGIHSRLNLQTGVVEAKLLDEDSEKNTGVLPLPRTNFGDSNGGVNEENLSENRLREIFKSISDIDTDETDVEVNEDVKHKFRSYDELKREFQDMKMSIKTDTEIISELWERLKGADHTKEIVTILTDLEYLLHQTDNAVNFAQAGGLSSVILTAINSSNSQVAVAALRLLGSASQSNPKVQIAALESGAVEKVLRLVRNPELSSTALHALSCVIRRFPLAQKTFVQHGGLAVMASLFDDSYRKGNTLAEDVNVQWRAKVKAVSLLHDLLMEQYQSDEQARKQYEHIGLKEQINNSVWCKLFPSLLTVLDDHDATEKAAEAMLAFWDTCEKQFLPAASVIFQAEKYYTELSKSNLGSESGDEDLLDSKNEYFVSLANLLSKLAEKIRLMKDEL